MLNLFPWLSQDPQPQPPAKRWRRKYTKSQKLYAIRGATAQARRRLKLEAELEKLINDNQILKRRIQGLGMSLIKEVQRQNGWDSPVTGVKP
jgi:NADH:ubiquinone oxidoreductase subunit D